MASRSEAPVARLRVFRIVHRQYAGEAFSGKGGLFAAGRWHTRGRLVAYASESLALAALEQIGRAGTMKRLKEMMYVPADLDAGAVQSVDAAALPDGWDQRPPGRASQHFGDAWLASFASVALRVPSVILPVGCNYVLNPAHPGFAAALTIYDARPLDLDPRITERLEVRK